MRILYFQSVWISGDGEMVGIFTEPVASGTVTNPWVSRTCMSCARTTPVELREQLCCLYSFFSSWCPGASNKASDEQGAESSFQACRLASGVAGEQLPVFECTGNMLLLFISWAPREGSMIALRHCCTLLSHYSMVVPRTYHAFLYEKLLVLIPKLFYKMM